MIRRKTTLFLVAAMSFSACAADGPTTRPLSADEILAEIAALPAPVLDPARKGDQTYMREYRAQWAARWQRQAKLELEFSQRFPDHPQAEYLQVRRWANQLTSGADASGIAREVDQYLKEHPDGPKSELAAGMLSVVRVRLVKDDPPRLLALAQEMAKKNPHDEMVASCFLMVAEATREPEQRDKLLRQIIVDYPNSEGAIQAGGILRRASQIGMPFRLGFFEATSGNWIAMENLRGKVVVIDFWATWCGPCVAEIPHLQKLYAQYKERGLEIIGVSLDGPRNETSLDVLKNFVAKRGVTWPQYYQGDGFDSAFSASWGIQAIPAVFVIDQEGKLYSTDASREKLDKILERLLPKEKK